MVLCHKVGNREIVAEFFKKRLVTLIIEKDEFFIL